jgi:hypothetical protein
MVLINNTIKEDSEPGLHTQWAILKAILASIPFVDAFVKD